MKWTEDAERTLESVPPFVRMAVRKSVQAFAARAGTDVITPDLLAQAKAELMPNAHDKTKGIERFFAREGVDPLESAFDTDSGPHPGMRGEAVPVEDVMAAWDESASVVDKSTRRALYIHVPFCRSRCSFCPFYTYKSCEGELAEYAKALAREMESVSELPTVAGHPIHSVYFGGGTPTDLAAEDLFGLISSVRTLFPLANDCEITIEGRVSGFTEEKMRACINGGANRFSIGVQSFHTQIRRGVGRKAGTDEVLSALEKLCSLDSAAVVIDLIYGLPGQTMETWETDIETFINKTGAHGIDLYKLKMVPGSVMSEHGKTEHSPDTRLLAQMYKRGSDILAEHGLKQLSNCHWGRGTRERNRYNTDTAFGGTCIPIGCCAGGKIGGYRFFQESDLKRYHESVRAGKKPIASAMKQAEHLGACEEIAGHVALGAIDMRVFERYSGAAMHGFNRLIDQWESYGLLRFTSRNRIELTTAGRFWSTKIAQNLIECTNCDL